MFPEQIAAGARTVTAVARHFSELTADAKHLLATLSVTKRGYFTPTEDEEVRHLLVSYWQARNALIEMVYQFQADEELRQEHRPAGFLVAFAAALVLIDAARFLRENLHDRHVVRAKLNEPEPAFGIPEGTYDSVQASLTSPIHAWHLYHALGYWEQHQWELRELGKDPVFLPLIEIIERLRSRLQVDFASYAVARLRLRTRQLWTAMHRDLLHRAMYGLQKLAGEVAANIRVRPSHRPQLPPAVIAELRDVLRPGDVLITRKEHALTNYFLPGYWPHAALFLGHQQQLEQLGISGHANVAPRWRRLLAGDAEEPRRVLEAMKDGVLIRSLASPCGVDAICVLRPQLGQPEIAEALTRGLFHEGKCYDFDLLQPLRPAGMHGGCLSLV
ncbi:MAG: hypothetical protein IAF94_24415 [Pirellulaceae bacterium]|nr:hypothetical protein [Pirellulaceae bacterium]